MNNKKIAKTFKTGGKGLGKVLGRLEEEVMCALWKRGESCGKEVLREIQKRRKIAYTTVLTVLERLARKGLVHKRKENGGYLFSPAHTKEEFYGTVSEEVLKGVIDLSSTYAAASFVDILADKDPGELDRLARLIEAKKQELRKD